MSNRLFPRATAVALALALGLVTAACGDDDGDDNAAAGASTAASSASASASADSPAADLRAALETSLQEHVYLAGAATGAALAGRQAEFDAAAGALDANSVALSKAIGSVYGAKTENTFLGLWRTHIGFFVDYTTGTAAKDAAKQEKAVADLGRYAQDFGAFLSGINPELTKDAVAELVTGHVLTLKTVVDAQAGGDPKMAYAELMEAAHHMTMIAEPLSGAIVEQSPHKFDH